MLIVALVLAVVGILTVFGSFVFVALNMSRSFSANTHNRNRIIQPGEVARSDMEDAFSRHIKAMVGLALGGLCLAVSGLIALAFVVISLLASA